MTPLPMVQPEPGLPERVTIYEVGPRDGFQNEPETIPTADKIRLIDMLMRTGVRRIEVTSFVRPDVLPQLSDNTEVLALHVQFIGARRLGIRTQFLQECRQRGIARRGDLLPESLEQVASPLRKIDYLRRQALRVKR